MREIKGAGGGGGDQTPRAPVESPDSLVSIARARLVDLVSEGEIGGLVDGLRSVYLGGTPVEAAGSVNFAGVKIDYRTGTQDQTHLPGFAQVESEIVVGYELRYGFPYVRSITNLQLSAVRINFSVPRLSRQDPSNGDLTGYRVDYQIEVAQGSAAPFVVVKTAAFDGKTTGGYERSERVDLTGQPSGGWRIRVTRLTIESDSSAISEQVNIRSVTEILDAKFRYPNSAVMGIEFDAQTFAGNIPVRAYELYGRIIRVPVNYDPATRIYTGVWNGTFKLAYTNNPAWICYDMALHPRYGLGKLLNAAQMDKWGLYQIAQYCDVPVDNGKGGTEPRFTCNCYIQTRKDALRVMQDLVSVFKGIVFWAAGQAYISADMPGDPVYTYTNANVVGGKFSYRGSKLSTRYTTALVTWNDPADMYKAKQAYVDNPDAVGRFGIRPMQITAFGCTSESQAIRAGRWALYTNLLETESVIFNVGLDGIQARPGQIIRIADNDRAGKRIGGRIKSATLDTVTVDNIAEAAIGDDLTCIIGTGEAETRTINSIIGKVVHVSTPFSSVPLASSPFVYESVTLAAQVFRVTGISETGPMEFSINAVRHSVNKFAAIDDGVIVSDRPITAIPSSRQKPPTDVTASTDYQVDQYAAVTNLTIRWTAAEGAYAYDVEWERDNSNWISAGRVSTTEVTVQGVYAGEYRCRVKAVNSMGVLSVWAVGGPFALAGKTVNLLAPVGLATTSEVFAIRVKWGIPTGALDMAYTELAINSVASDVGATTLSLLAFPTVQYLHSGMAAAITRYFKARFIDKSGNQGPWTDWVPGISEANADVILDYLLEQITQSQLATDLSAEVDKISGPPELAGSVNARILVVSDSVNELGDEVEALQAQVADILAAPAWNDDVAWLAGDLVQDGGYLYRAKINVPIGVAISNTTYWENLGAYTTLGGLVSALSVRMTQAEIDIDENTGEITTLSNELTVIDSRVTDAETGISANSTAIGLIETQVTEVDGKVVAQGQSLASLNSRWRDDDGEGALASALNQRTVTANYALEVKTRASADQALVQVTETLNTQIGANSAQIANVQQTVTDNATSTASQFTTVNASILANTNSINTVSAAVVTETSARVAADSAISSQVSNNSAAITNETSARTAAINAEQTARVDADGVLATSITNVSAAVTTETNNRIAAINSEATARTTADGILATNITTVSGAVTTETANRTAAVAAEQLARISADDALAYNITVVSAAVTTETTNRTAAVSAEQTARVNADTSLASSITATNVVVGNNSAGVSTNATAIGTINGKLSATYNIKVGVDVNGRYYGAGMGIGVENTPAGMQGTILFTADKFAILQSSSPGSSPILPFAVVGGQTIINTAVIGDATINFAKITDTLQSTNYSAGVSGWRIAKNGAAEINSLVARGTMQSGTYSPGVSGWKIDNSGSAEFNGIVLTRTNVVTTGVKTRPGATLTTADFIRDTGSGLFPSGGYIEVYVDIPTSTYLPELVTKVDGKMLTAQAVVTNSQYFYSGGLPTAPAYETPCAAEVLRVASYGLTGSFLRILLKVYTPTNVKPNVNAIQITEITWSLSTFT